MSSASALSIKEENRKMNMKEKVRFVVNNNEVAIKAIVENSFKVLAPVWPLETFIACNPLHGFESQHFDDAFLQNLQVHAEYGNASLKAVNLQIIKWCNAFFDAGQAPIPMPNRERGFYLAFLELAHLDKKLHHNKKALKQWLCDLPTVAEETIRVCLDRLEVPRGQEDAFIKRTLLYLPGWGGYVKWHAQWQDASKSVTTPISLSDFVAVRLVITTLLWPGAAKENHKIGDSDLPQTLIKKLKRKENEYRDTLLDALLPQVEHTKTEKQRADAQLVFCIDVRSEPFRRAIEALGNYETLGFAGFYGLPIRVDDYKSGKTKDCCPVLLKPRFHIDEAPSVSTSDLRRYEEGKTIRSTFKNIYEGLKYNFSTPFALVESLGLWCGMNMLLKTVSPVLGKRLSQSINRFIVPDIDTHPSFELNECDLDKGIALDEQITYAETVLRLMGLVTGFGKIIVLCGHGSLTENNPYASALDCGACGGNHGATNAKLLAAILNKHQVRRALEEKGIHIPLDTVFYGALHNTTTDAIEIYNVHRKEVIYPEIFNQLLVDLNIAKGNNNKERGEKLAAKHASKDIMRRSQDWSETRPEWGLARNAAFIVAPRALTANLNLDGRCFLHSYEWESDENGSCLETILTAPMVVAQWINTQYLFSTLDNVRYGSGSKITHNVTGKIGVMQGNGSDLMHGLSLQSVMSSDDTPYHEPQRLLTVVYAKRGMVYRLIEKQDILKTLFFNEWVHLIVIDPSDHLPYKLDKTGDWVVSHRHCGDEGLT